MLNIISKPTSMSNCVFKALGYNIKQSSHNSFLHDNWKPAIFPMSTQTYYVYIQSWEDKTS